jgi:cytochrome c biogenesis protein CcmG/thiol:disulfide interchange protein DsbE
MNRFLWPLIGFVVLVVLLAVGLTLNPRDVPSPLVGKPAPAFSLPRLHAPEEQFSPRTCSARSGCSTSGHRGASRADRNIRCWSNWRNARPCRWSASTTRKSAATARSTSTRCPRTAKGMVIERAGAWLRQHGDPYTLSVLDIDGRVGIDYGVYGVPETYVIDKAGIIRMKHTGPITPDVLSARFCRCSRSCRNEALADGAAARAARRQRWHGLHAGEAQPLAENERPRNA